MKAVAAVATLVFVAFFSGLSIRDAPSFRTPLPSAPTKINAGDVLEIQMRPDCKASEEYRRFCVPYIRVSRNGTPVSDIQGSCTDPMRTGKFVCQWPTFDVQCADQDLALYYNDSTQIFTCSEP
tara:strand:+ start:243 stop:614 length:372 start_codon:yes stop_codon:yes gene_type:complete